MPELPEVQTVVTDLIAAGLPGRRIVRVQVRWPGTIAAPSVNAFVQRLRGVRIVALGRRAKYIVITLASGETLLAHLRMSGRFHCAAAGEPPAPHDRVIFELDDRQSLRFHDTRKFGRISLLRDPHPVFKRLGIEPLSRAFTPAALAKILRSRGRTLKPLLLDQTLIAGIGNIYADEALWEARLHPLRRSASLSGAEVNALQRAIRSVLRRAIRNAGTSLGAGKGNFRSPHAARGRHQEELRAYQRTGEPCLRCAAVIVRIIVGQRSTHLCPRCQRLSADRSRPGVPARAPALSRC